MNKKIFILIIFILIFELTFRLFSYSKPNIYKVYLDEDVLALFFLRGGNDVNFNFIHKDYFDFLEKSENYNTNQLIFQRKPLLLEKDEEKKKELQKEIYRDSSIIEMSCLSIEMKLNLEETIDILEKNIINEMHLYIRYFNDDCGIFSCSGNSFFYFSDYEIILLLGIAYTLTGDYKKGLVFLAGFINYRSHINDEFDIQNNLSEIFDKLKLNECFIYMDAYYYLLLCMSKNDDKESMKECLEYSELLYHRKFNVYLDSKKEKVESMEIIPELWNLSKEYEKLKKSI